MNVSGSTNASINVGYWNIHGYTSKVIGQKVRDREFLDIIGDCDVIGIGEIQSSSKIDIEGYISIDQKIRDKTTNGPKIAGGIGVFVKKEISHLVELIPNDNEDSIWVHLKPELTKYSESVYLGTFYVSPANKNNKSYDFLKSVNEEVYRFMNKGAVLIQGDFNARTASDKDFAEFFEEDPILGGKGESQVNRNSEDKNKNPRGEELLDLCKLNNLLIANGRKPGDLFGKFTCHNWNGSSVVDYMVFSECLYSIITRFLVGNYIPWLSDHCIIKTSLICGNYERKGEENSSQESVHPGFIWDEESIDVYKSNLKKLCNEVKIKALLNAPISSPSQLAGEIKDLLWRNTELSNLRKKKVDQGGNKSEPWFDKECLESKKQISNLGKKLAQNPSDQTARISVLEAKRYFRKIALAKKRRYRKNIVSDLEKKRSCGKAKDFWKTLRKISPKNEKDTVQPSMSEYMSHFKTISNSTRPQDTPDLSEEIGPLDFDITLEELLDACKKLVRGKAFGFDDICNEMIKCLVEVYPGIVLKLFNGILKSGKSVRDWQFGMIVPIHKDGARSDPNNYRGITLMSCLGKLFLSIINSRLIIFALEKGILSISQLGFVAGNRTSDAHIILHSLISKYCHRKNSKIFSCFVDFKKAFDSVPRDTLLKKLLNIGITGKVFNIIRDIYTSDQACIKLDGSRSPMFNLSLGVRQGCILSPLLFNIFLCDLAKKLSELNTNLKLKDTCINSLFWADDLVLLADSEEKLKEMLKILEDYCRTNELTINTKKTKCMTFNKGGRLLSRDFYLNGTKLENVRSYKYLGFILTPSGEINTGLQDLRDRGFKAFMKLKRDFGESFNYHVPTALLLFESLIKPIITYCSDFWGCIKYPKTGPTSNMYEYMCKYNPIEKLYTSICKQILGVQKQTTNVGVLLELGLTPVYLSAIKFSVKNWERIRKGHANEMLKSAFSEASSTNLPWTNGIKSILEVLGMPNYYSDDHLDKPNFIYKKTFQRMSDIFHQNTLEKIRDNAHKLRTYAIYKKKTGLEDYLINVKSISERINISKFRLSNHRLMIETGRHRGLGKEERFCPFCPNKVEDEYHFLFECNTYKHQRLIYLNPIIKKIRGFQNFCVNEQLEILMCKMDNNLCKYISDSLDIRAFLESKPRRLT